MLSRDHRSKATRLVLAGCFSAFAIWGCSSEGEQPSPPPLAGGELGHGGAPPKLGLCEEDQDFTRDCTVYVEQANGITSCFNGIQFCDNGGWSDCIDPDHDPRVE